MPKSKFLPEVPPSVLRAGLPTAQPERPDRDELLAMADRWLQHLNSYVNRCGRELMVALLHPNNNQGDEE